MCQIGLDISCQRQCQVADAYRQLLPLERPEADRAVPCRALADHGQVQYALTAHDQERYCRLTHSTEVQQP